MNYRNIFLHQTLRHTHKNILKDFFDAENQQGQFERATIKATIKIKYKIDFTKKTP